ncbi:reticulon-4-interacting protein 1, mitochondrial-like isoform X2 [Uloborus diversus]|nr:reticulon-4-interacting protein 1, mitochondrial-like isoform X2 [Uloborus diversus]XP_054719930.1 reticulon-4-interacting protein 1, mitochondrial-like isoform X2 [Uloborus diversus]XP_054720008.1 reticulon-4-interacting protein 1, mitochondrial-like isoform X2 [Uloborus diversus]XP_054720077.1 reticulon-4-interacting protein 1, mitochondrial-like isoform X2 [Uloborus diversus]XP_054720135.1 reticulon-4-interacting protein 1, mitochondrial-like isoform X2 [Uloborus diversus]
MIKSNQLLKCHCFAYAQKCGIKTMRAWQLLQYGSPENLKFNEDGKIPILKDTMDVLVKVHAASINPLDVRMTEGYGRNAFNFVRQVNQCSLTPQNEFPLILGRDFSGTIAYVGKNVKKFKCGDEVWGATSPWENGSHADYLLAHSCKISKKPESLNHLEAASFPYAALTAWAAIRCFAGLSEKNSYGKRILITGASGGVGTFAVQLLKAWGADVSVTCRADAVELMQNLGADAILDYTSQDFKSTLSDLKGLDVIIDNIGGDYPALTIELLKKMQSSKYVTVVSPLLKNTDEQGVLLGTASSAVQATLDTVMSLKDGRSFRWAYFMPNMCALKSIARMIDEKQIVPVIEKTFKFEEIQDAYKKVSDGHARGKVVVNFEMSSSSNTSHNHK